MARPWEAAVAFGTIRRQCRQELSYLFAPEAKVSASGLCKWNSSRQNPWKVVLQSARPLAVCQPLEEAFCCRGKASGERWELWENHRVQRECSAADRW